MADTKTINETFTDAEHKQLIIVKGDLTWHDFIMTLLRKTKKDDIK